MKIRAVSRKDFNQWSRPLPKKEREQLWEWVNQQGGLEVAAVDERIKATREAMNRDLQFGIPWFLMLGLLWFGTGLTPGTIVVFFLGIIYFTYSFFTTGSFGLNRKRLKVYKAIRDRNQEL